MKSFKLKIMFYLIPCILYLASASDVDAAYRVYLKNGSVIRGVSHYEKSKGEVIFYFEGGMIGISEKDILKIESSAEPVKDLTAPKEEAETVEPDTRFEEPDTRFQETEPEPAVEEAAPNDIEAQIAEKEAELRGVEGELITTRVRIQNLFNKTSPEERSMLQQNMFKKRELEAEKERLEREIQQLKGQL